MLNVKQLRRIKANIITLVMVCATFKQGQYVIRICLLLHPYEQFYSLIVKTTEQIKFFNVFIRINFARHSSSYLVEFLTRTMATRRKSCNLSEQCEWIIPYRSPNHTWNKNQPQVKAGITQMGTYCPYFRCDFRFLIGMYYWKRGYVELGRVFTVIKGQFTRYNISRS